MPTSAYVSLLILLVIAVIVIYRVVKGKKDARAHAEFEAQQAALHQPSDAATVPPADDATTTHEEEEEMPATIESLTKEGDELYAKGENSDARDKYSEALDQARDAYNSLDPRLAAALLNYAKADLAYDGDEYDEDTAPDTYLEALSILDQAHGPTSERILPALEGLIAFYDRVGAHGKSSTVLNRIASINAATKAAAAEASRLESLRARIPG